ncbi:hypothetical protein J2T20_004618 [Paenibacillus wynnii]|nr:hypothetical protein [Paenibacillus wynnii]
MGLMIGLWNRKTWRALGALIGEQGELHKITEKTAYEPDLKSRPNFLDWRFILVADRAYGKHKLFDSYQEQENR